MKATGIVAVSRSGSPRSYTIKQMFGAILQTLYCQLC